MRKQEKGCLGPLHFHCAFPLLARRALVHGSINFSQADMREILKAKLRILCWSSGFVLDFLTPIKVLQASSVQLGRAQTQILHLYQ